MENKILLSLKTFEHVTKVFFVHPGSVVSPGKECVWELNVLNRGLFGVPLRFDGVSSCQYSCTSVQLANNSRLYRKSQENEN